MMRVRLERVDRAVGLPWFGVVALGLWIILVGAGVLLTARGWIDPSRAPALCLFKRVTEVPCATCGGTRMAAAALRGDPLDAILINPFLAVALAWLAGWLVLRLGLGRRLVVDAPGWLRVGVWAFVVGAFLGNWAMLILRGV